MLGYILVIVGLLAAAYFIWHHVTKPKLTATRKEGARRKAEFQREIDLDIDGE